MAEYEAVEDLGSKSSGDYDDGTPLYGGTRRQKSPYGSIRTAYLLVLHFSNLTLLLCTIFLISYIWKHEKHDPSLQVYSPANGAVEYVEKHFQAAFFTQTEYMGSSDIIDQKWEDLYNCKIAWSSPSMENTFSRSLTVRKVGNSIISEKEAKKLHTPTLPIPGTKDYLVQLDVWHELHCLNDIRKVFYPERFGDQLANITVDGTVQRNNNMFRHWEHCLDSLRQTLMCHADVSPISFHVNVPENKGIFARLATTHTCKNFDKIRDWAKAHTAGTYKYLLSPDEALAIIDTAGFDQSPEEDIESFWPSFPGNPFFKHWRDKAATAAPI